MCLVIARKLCYDIFEQMFEEGDSMELGNIPVQVIVHCEAGGELKPLRFRYEDDEHVVHTIQVDQITDTRKTAFVGIDAIHCICKGSEQGAEHLYELRYTIRTHKWVLYRQIY